MKNNFLKFILIFIIPMSLAMTSCSDDDEALSDLAGITEFGFMANEGIPGLENYSFTIDHTTNIITNEVELPYGCDVSSLIAQFKTTEFSTVTVAGQDFVSGETALDYTDDVNINITAEDGKTVEMYTVRVMISDVNPDGVTWVQKQAMITDFNYLTVHSVYFKGKHRAIFGNVNESEGVSVYMTSTDGVTWTEEAIDKSSFPMGCKHGLVVFKDKMYICGYASMDENRMGIVKSGMKEIWESTDGVTFTKRNEVNNYNFDYFRVEPAFYTIDNELYVVGGHQILGGNFDGGTGPDSDFAGPAGLSQIISSTADFNTWDEPYLRVLPEGNEGENLNLWGKPEDAMRRYAANVLHNNKMFMIGGQQRGGYLSDLVWYSEDAGNTWNWIKPSGLTPRMGAAAISYNGKLWLIGGQTAKGVCTKEILVSEDDGASWMPAGDETMLPDNFKPRANHSVTVDDENNIWIIGGYNASLNGDEEEHEMLKDAWCGKIANILE